MDARNRSLADWFTRIRTGQIKLPRFQRHEAWDHNEIASLLEAVFRGLPAGAALILEVGNEEPFLSRFLETAPEGRDRVTEHLLDGQQRLTSLWRALHDNYDARSCLVRWEDDPNGGPPAPRVLSQARWERRGVRYPVWCDEPAQVWHRGYTPVHLFNPEDNSQVRAWADAAAEGNLEVSRDIESRLVTLRGEVAAYNIPYLSLPVTTPKDVALDVFIKMNTSSVRLSAFDIVVAQLEEVTGQSLHDLVDDLRAVVPAAAGYRDLGNLVLDVAALRSNRAPTQASYQRLDLAQVQSEWTQIIDGVRWGAGLLADEHVFDADRLPSIIVLPVLAALHKDFPAALDAAGNARTLATAYLWRSFLTRRYEQSAASRSLQDLRGLRKAVIGNKPTADVDAPIFDLDQTPLPEERDLRSAGWPKTRDILARGVLAASLRVGGIDLADGQPARADNLAKREYHHLFPDSLLTGIGGLESGRSFTALNCALVTWSTNRNISNKAPLQYLEERLAGAHLDASVVRSRLSSHLVPYEELAAAGPYGPEDGTRVVADYEAFLVARAALVLPVLQDLCHGRQPSVSGTSPS